MIPVPADKNRFEAYLVIRVYRGKARVMSMHDSSVDAEPAYQRVAAELRDGDVMLVFGTFEKVKVESGGYNRTRW